MIKLFRTFGWPLGSGLMLAASLVHPPWTIRAMQLTGDFCSHTLYQSFIGVSLAMQLTGDFCSHTLYQSFIGVSLALLLWRGARRNKRYFWWAGLAAALTPLCVEGLKRVTRLPRPDGEPSGFPSGHTTFAFALAWLLTQAYPRGTPLWFAVAIAIGWSRVEGHAHFPYQVLCGALLGTAVGWLISHKIARPPSGATLAPETKFASGEA